MLDHLSTFGPGFSFSTTLTLVSQLTGFTTKFVPIEYRRRTGRSKVRFFRDSLRAAQILIEAILMHNPIKVFLVLSGATLILGLGAATASFFFPKYPILTILGAGGILSSFLILGMGFMAVVVRRLLQATARPADDRSRDAEPRSSERSNSSRP